MVDAIKSTASVIREAQERWIAQTTEKQKAIIDEFKEIARAWHAEEMPLREAMRLTSSGFLRNQVSRRIMIDDPAYDVWQGFLMAIIADQNATCQLGVETHQGFLARFDIERVGGVVQQVYDHERGEYVCAANFPPVADNREIRRVAFLGDGGTTPATLADWEE